MLRTENTARTLHAIANQASAYIRIADPIQCPPPYINLQHQSEWYHSALSTLAIESLTLPSRLRSTTGRGSTLSDFEAILNAEGNQTIFELSTNIPNASTPRVNGHTNGVSSQHTTDSATEPGHALPVDLTPVDPSYTPPNHDRTFAQILVSRSSSPSVSNPQPSDSQAPPDPDGPTITTFQSHTLFPILSSFPSDLITNLPPHTSSVSVRSALTTTSRTQARIQALNNVVRYSTSVEDREELYSGLADLGERYESGWVSEGEDEDED